MTSPLWKLTIELRQRIYGLVLCTQGPAIVLTHSWEAYRCDDEDGESRFDQPAEQRYPPTDKGWKKSKAKKKTGARSSQSDDPMFEHLLVHSLAIPADECALEDYGLSFRDGKVEMGPNPDAEEGFPDDEEDEYDDESEDENEDSEDAFDSFVPYTKHRPSYELHALEPFNLALLYVNRQINDEATPVFYRGIDFVPSSDAVQAMRFFKTLPARALQNITTVMISSDLLLGDDAPSRLSWSGEPTQSLTRSAPSMSTPFGAFLAIEMPKLADVYLYTPIGGDEDYYCTWAPSEMCRLLCSGRIERLHYVFQGEEVAEVLATTRSSHECFERISDPPLGRRTAENEWETVRPPPDDGPYPETMAEREALRQAMLAWFDEQDRYIERHSKLFEWKWGSRDIAMGPRETVQAVVTTWLK